MFSFVKPRSLQFVMKILFVIAITLTNVLEGLGQNSSNDLSKIITDISSEWKTDSSSCNGFRRSTERLLVNCSIDFVNKDFLLKELGKPDYIQKFLSGIGNKRANYVGYRYYIYKDSCPQIAFESWLLEFIFDESQTRVLEVKMIHTCG